MAKKAASVTMSATMPARPAEGSTQGSGSDGSRAVSATALMPSSLVGPVRVVWMLEIPERPAAPHHGQGREVVLGRRRRGAPLERPGVPGVAAGGRAAPERCDDVPREDEHG